MKFIELDNGALVDENDIDLMLQSGVLQHDGEGYYVSKKVIGDLIKKLNNSPTNIVKPPVPSEDYVNMQRREAFSDVHGKSKTIETSSEDGFPIFSFDFEYSKKRIKPDHLSPTGNMHRLIEKLHANNVRNNVAFHSSNITEDLLRKSRERAGVDQEGEKLNNPNESKFSSPDSVKSVGVKFDDDKCGLQFLPKLALEGTAWVFKYGAEKYAGWNHSKGMPWSKMWRAAEGHMHEVAMGNFIDEESGMGHIYHAICSLMMLAENMVLHPNHNDLYPEQYDQNRAAIELHRAQTKAAALKVIKQFREKKK